MIKHTIRRSKRSNATVERATVNIGKKGSTDFLMNEIFRRLKQRKVVKVRILKTALIGHEAKEMARKVAEETGSRIVEIRGHTFTLHRPKRS